MEEFLPSELLAPFIKSYKIIESRNGSTNIVLPGTSLAMSFRFKGQTSYLNNNHQISLPFAAISGLQRSARHIHYSENAANIIVLFKETGASAFCNHPLHEYYAQSISLDNLFPSSEISVTLEQLEACSTNAERIAIIEAFLISKLKESSQDKLVNEAVRKIYTTNGNIRINHLINELYLSKDAFEKRFRKLTGATPKQFAHIVKMNTVVRQYKNVSSYLDIAYDNGFYDQPHFNKDFKRFTGQTPTEFFKNALFW